MASDSRTHLAALRRVHAVNSRSQLDTLESRVRGAKERAAALQKRVEVCAEKASVHERRERAEVKRHKRRVGVLWAVLAAMSAIWLATALWRGREKIMGELEGMEIGIETALGKGNQGSLSRELRLGEEELRTALRSKGVEWALERGSGGKSEVRYRHGTGSLEEVGQPTGGSRKKMVDARLESMFETL